MSFREERGSHEPPVSEKDKMLAGKLYNASDPELVELRSRSRELQARFNSLPPSREEERQDILHHLLGSCGSPPTVETGFHCDYGFNIHVGKHFYANFNCTILDVCEVRIGDSCLLAPNVVICTATHPVDPAVRESMIELGKPITIGDNVWIGASAVINPGVRIGDNAVVGSGSVVTRDVPANTVVVGNPAKVLRRTDSREKAAGAVGTATGGGHEEIVSTIPVDCMEMQEVIPGC